MECPRERIKPNQTADGDVLLWPGFTFDYWRRTRQVDLANYETRPAIAARAPIAPGRPPTRADAHAPVG